MKIIYHWCENQATKQPTLEEFADQYGLTMEVWQRPQGRLKFYAHFTSAEVKEGGFLHGIFGDGDTPEEAMADYARKISGKVMRVDIGMPGARVIYVPILAVSA